MRHLLILLLGVALPTLLHAGPDKSPPPNFILILSDDQAWTDYGFMGHKQIQTPALDKLAAQSLAYTRGYVAAPLCRPSLASLFTGLHPFQTGITGNDLLDGAGGKAARNNPEGARLHQQLYDGFRKCPSLASDLGKEGYLSFQTGKWWEGDPRTSGFTHAMTHGDPQKGARHGDEGLAISREGIQPIREFLDVAKAEKKPFFIWHAPFLPHSPHNPPAGLFKKYEALVESKHVARYYAMVEWFDQTCGELFAELETRGLTDNTVIIYVTDNGWIQNPGNAAYAPRSKQDIHEGGVRTPIMIKWPGQIAPHRDATTPVSSIDIPVTIRRIAGAEVPPVMTGLDLRDREALRKRDTVFGADHAHDIAGVDKRVANLESRYIVQGEWKLILHSPSPRPGGAGRKAGGAGDPEDRMELYNLLQDPAEKNNLAAANPDKVATLAKALNTWWDGTDPRN